MKSKRFWYFMRSFLHSTHGISILWHFNIKPLVSTCCTKREKHSAKMTCIPTKIVIFKNLVQIHLRMSYFFKINQFANLQIWNWVKRSLFGRIPIFIGEPRRKTCVFIMVLLQNDLVSLLNCVKWNHLGNRVISWVVWLWRFDRSSFGRRAISSTIDHFFADPGNRDWASGSNRVSMELVAVSSRPRRGVAALTAQEIERILCFFSYIRSKEYTEEYTFWYTIKFSWVLGIHLMKKIQEEYVLFLPCANQLQSTICCVCNENLP